MPRSPQTICDAEFGDIIVKRRTGARSVRIHLGTGGRFTVSCGRLTPLKFIREFIDQSRGELRRMAARTSIASPYQHGQAIGKQHRIAVVPTQMVEAPSAAIRGQHIIVKLPPAYALEDGAVQQQIRDAVGRALRKEAKQLLPPLLAKLAAQYNFHYARVRFSHAGSRWGSCSSTGTISLNIALMKLPDELIRYVLVHELCHTRHMNHSIAFWREVERYDPHYRTHRQQIKRHTPVL